jgi:hypothetical protein
MDESAQSELRGFDAAAHRRSALEHYAAKTGFRQIRRRDQAVVSRAGNDNIKAFRRGRLPRQGG